MALSKTLSWSLILLVPGAALAGATASNFKPETRKGANYWNAQSALDGDPKTVWQLPGDSPNRGEWIQIDIPPGDVDQIGIWPGWGKSDESYLDYARVKTLKVEYLCCMGDDSQRTIGTQTIQVADENRMQWIDVDDIRVGNDLFGGTVKLSVVDIYKGKDFPNLAVSEVLVGLKEFDAIAEIMPSDEDPEHIIMDAQDDNKRTFWSTGAEKPSLEITSETFGLSSVGIQAGPKTHARPKTVKVTAQGRSRVQVLEDIPELQWLQIPAITGYTGSAWGAVTVEFIDTYEGSSSQDLAVAEIMMKATNMEGL